MLALQPELEFAPAVHEDHGRHRHLRDRSSIRAKVEASSPFSESTARGHLPLLMEAAPSDAELPALLQFQRERAEVVVQGLSVVVVGDAKLRPTTAALDSPWRLEVGKCHISAVFAKIKLLSTTAEVSPRRLR